MIGFRFCGLRIYTFLTIFIFFVVLVNAYSGQQNGKQRPPFPVVKVFTVVERNVNPPEEYVGHVEAIKFVDLIARVEGFIEKVNFKEGDWVSKGDLLYQIEKAPYEARVKAARADVAKAKANLERARRWLERLRSAKPESVRAYDMDKAIADELSAKAQLEAAEANLRLAVINLRYTAIKAPISGRIGKTKYTEGNLVNRASGPLARIVQMDPIRVVYSISEDDVPMIQAAMSSCGPGADNPILRPKLRFYDGTVYNKAGRIEFVDNEIDPSTGTIAVRAIFENKKGLLIPGQYVVVLVSKTKPKLMPIVPQAAVLMNKNGPYVFVVGKGDIVEARPVELGPSVRTFWAVKRGLRKGDLVVAGGLHRIRPGQRVVVKKAKGF